MRAVAVAVALVAVLGVVGPATAGAGVAEPVTGTAERPSGAPDARAVEPGAPAVARQSGGTVDVVFVLDDTGSMSEEIAGAKANIRGFAADLEAEGIDARYGLVTFNDDVEVDQALTGDVDALQASLDGVTASGGGDAREDNFDALKTATEMEFRPGAKRVIVDITDERAHTRVTDDDHYEYRDGRYRQTNVTRYTMPDVVEFMEPFAAYIAVSDADIYETRCSDPLGPRCGDKRVLAQENLDDGSWVDLDQVDRDEESDFGDILDTVERVITDVVEEPGGSGDAPDIEYVDAGFNRTTVSPGGTVRVNVTAVNRGEAAGSYVAAFRNDLELVGTRRGRLDAGESVRLSANVTFEDTGDHRLFAAQDYLGTVTVEGLTAAETSARYLDVEYAYLTRLHATGGTGFEVVAVVRSTADSVDEFTVTSKRRDGGGAVSETVILEPGERRVVRQPHAVGSTPERTRLQEWRVNGEPAGNLTVHPSRAALPTGVLYTYVTRSEVEPGDRYDVVAVVHNGADSERGVLVTVARGESEVTSVLRLLAPGETQRVRYDAVAGEPGTVEWTVNDDRRAGTVVVSYSERRDDTGS